MSSGSLPPKYSLGKYRLYKLQLNYVSNNRGKIDK